MIYASTITDIQKGDKIIFYPKDQTICFVRDNTNMKFHGRDNDKFIIPLIKKIEDFFQVAYLIAEIKGLKISFLKKLPERKVWCCEFK
jgi:hypothetical protein